MIRNVDAGQAQALMASGEVDVIDVREPHEWVTGHIVGSRLLPLGRLRSAPKALLPRDGVIFICAAGVRSETAARLAVGLGFKQVYNLSGGTRAWVKAGLPLEQEPQRASAVG